MKRLLLTLLILAPAMTNAGGLSGTPSRNLISGNALVTPESIQKIVKAVIVKNLGKSVGAESYSSGLKLQIDAADYHLKIPQNAALLQVMDALGITDQVHVRIDPIQTSINFSPDSLKIKVEKTEENLFRIHAHWQVDELTAESKSLNMLVPKGAFDQDFTVASHPVKIGLKSESGAITADLTLTASLTELGSKINLESFETNLDDEVSRLQLNLGILTVNDKPLELQITSNGESITTDEPSIRAQFQSLEPELMKNVQKQLSKVIHDKFSSLSTKLQNEAPFRVAFESSEIINKYSMSDSPYAPLLKGIAANFVFSYIQDLPAQNLFTTQISSQICIDSKCLDDSWGTSSIGTTDTKLMHGHDAGVILYESWVQNVVNSDAFQSRVQDYYKSSLSSAGVTLGKDGIKIHFNPDKNAVVAVLNLVIDIKATVNPKGAWKSWSSFKTYFKDQVAGTWENLLGSGKYVYLPVEINFNIKGIKKNADGKRVLMITPEIPLRFNGMMNNTYGYTTNVDQMNRTIRKALIGDVKTIVSKSLPANIQIEADKPIQIGGVEFMIEELLVTKNKGLLMSGAIK